MLQSFLLIVRTLRIVTDALSVARDSRVFQHLARFIDSNGIYCLTTF